MTIRSSTWKWVVEALARTTGNSFGLTAKMVLQVSQCSSSSGSYCRFGVGLLVAIACVVSVRAGYLSAAEPARSQTNLLEYQRKCLRAAVVDLIENYSNEYPHGRQYLSILDALEDSWQDGDKQLRRQFEQLRREALIANPLLKRGKILLVKRRSRLYKPSNNDKKIWYSRSNGLDLGFPSNHECNSSLPRQRYDNEIAMLSDVRADGMLETVYCPDDGGYVGEVDLHWDADRLLFTKSDSVNWKIWEMNPGDGSVRQVSKMPDDVDCFDACYLPDGRIVFGSTASYQSVPCWHGQKLVSNLYIMDEDGGNVRQLCFDQDHDFHPSVMPNGQVLYHRWDYTGISHIFLRLLMVMNPDGTGQRAIYGSNSWFPNSLYFPRALPGHSNKLISVLSGYHGVHRMGQLVLVDTSRGWYEADGLAKRLSGRGDPITPKVRDNLVDQDWPKFLNPYPLSDKYFLVACWPDRNSLWGIYLVDDFDNLVLVLEEPGYALIEPILLRKRPKPPMIPDRVEQNRKDGIVYLHDVYAGPGLAGVPRGTVGSLRVIAYHFGYRGLAGPDKIGYGGPWEVVRILGTVPLEADGSAMFRVPANTPIALQPLDRQGKAVQLMRSWFTVMPGEVLSCIGCHESPADAAPVRVAVAAHRHPQPIRRWYGPARGFDFSREVQPVLNRYCLECHAGQNGRPDLRPREAAPDYKGRKISDLGVTRLHLKMREDTHGIVQYSPAYDALIPYIRRVGIEDDVSMLVPGEYHADTSELIQMIRKGHQGVDLDAEAWDRIVTWIDLNAPCHGTWGEVYPIPDGAHERRMALRRLYGGSSDDPEAIPDDPRRSGSPVAARPLQKPKRVTVDRWPFDAETARRHQRAEQPHTRTLDLGDGVVMRLVRIPAGQFVMGDVQGENDECPVMPVRLDRPFWMCVCEVTNEQYRRFDPRHDCRYYTKRHGRPDDQGLPLNGLRQPVVRVSWTGAMEFCRWLSRKTGMVFTLPTEAQWEYACRAGTDTPLSFGQVDADFTQWANLADRSFATGRQKDGKQITGGLEHLVMEGAVLVNKRFDDKLTVTAPVGTYKPNPWGLYDMHGNAAEWTCSTYRPYPYSDDDGRDASTVDCRKVVRGGSFFDRPKRCRSGFRLAYPAWQRIFNVGFRVVAYEKGQEPLGDKSPPGVQVAESKGR